MKKLFNELYRNEINMRIEWFFDSGFKFKIGDEINGFIAELNGYDFDAIEKEIVNVVKKYYPDSQVSKTYLEKHYLLREIREAEEMFFKLASSSEQSNLLTLINKQYEIIQKLKAKLEAVNENFSI